MKILLVQVSHEVSSMVCKTEPTYLKNVNIVKSYIH